MRNEGKGGFQDGRIPYYRLTFLYLKSNFVSAEKQNKHFPHNLG